MGYPSRVEVIFHRECQTRLDLPDGWCSECQTTPPTSEYVKLTYVLAEQAAEDHIVLRHDGRLWGIAFDRIGGGLSPSIIELDEEKFADALTTMSTMDALVAAGHVIRAKEDRLGRDLTDAERDAIMRGLRQAHDGELADEPDLPEVDDEPR